MGKKNVVILGGGMAALSTAWHITQDPGWKNQFGSVTVYQMGWRLGGKCAASRGASGRIEEHGIHLFGGGYYNALRMMRRVYRELHHSDTEFDAAFLNQFTSVSVEGNTRSAIRFPPSPLKVDAVAEVGSIAQWLSAAIDALKASKRDPRPADGESVNSRFWSQSWNDIQRVIPDVFGLSPMRNVLDRLSAKIRGGSNEITGELKALRLLFGSEPGAGLFGFDLLRERLFPADLPIEPLARSRFGKWMQTLNFIFALTNGWLEDIATRGRSFADLDATDYATWLRHHGAWPSTIELDIVQAPIRILYQYRHGDSKAPGSRSMGAGAYLHWTLRSLAYLQSPFWLFQDGTGDSVITPLYQGLRDRGVRFEFFHKVENLGLRADGKGVAHVTFRLQATTKLAGDYQPLDANSWPATPRYDDLHQGAELAQLPANELESYWSRFREDQLKTVDLNGDLVVFAISLGAVPIVCGELLAAQPDWRQLTREVQTVETQSIQLWMDQTSRQLGFDAPIDPDETSLGGGFATPFDGFCDFTELIAREKWPQRNLPMSLWYFSDVCETRIDPLGAVADQNYPARRQLDAQDQARRFLESDLPRLLPMQRHGFDYGRLVLTDPGRANTDAQKLAQQVVHTNYQPSDRYVQALAGTTRFRLDAGKSIHFDNLFLAGDWTYNGLNVGCVEASVMSGALAANDILGRRHDEGVIGYFGR